MERINRADAKARLSQIIGRVEAGGEHRDHPPRQGRRAALPPQQQRELKPVDVVLRKLIPRTDQPRLR